ncbi:MAG: hypothetical protein D6704_13730 [Nitrospirae bacterium]|nr:MAG: hypothetical protein D6704_13730 [Nitrospirota bacterium]
MKPGTVFPGWVWLAYALLFAATIPWYFPRNQTLLVWLGLPHWTVLSLTATLGVALFTVFVIRKFWR